jgi:hypothetical protein
MSLITPLLKIGCSSGKTYWGGLGWGGWRQNLKLGRYFVHSAFENFAQAHQDANTWQGKPTLEGRYIMADFALTLEHQGRKLPFCQPSAYQ